jgi:PAS domain S-box-containing protein
VLLVEDDEDDAQLVAHALQKSPNGVAITRVADEASFRRSLATGAFDIVLSDWNLPGFDALAALAIVREIDGDLPFVIVSGAVGEDAAVAAMRAGARDYVLKDRLGRLLPVVERELREAAERRARLAAERALQHSEERYRRVVETTTQGVWVIDGERKTTFVNARMAAMLRARAEDLIGVAPGSYIVDWRDTPVAEVILRFLQGSPLHGEVLARRTDGTTFLASVEATPIVDAAGVFEGGIALITDISERRAAQQALEARDAEIHERLRGEALLSDVGLALTEGTSLRDTLTRCVRALVTHADATLARVWLLDASKQNLDLVASAGLYERLDVPHQRIPIGRMAVGTIAATNQSHVSEDFPSDPLCGDPDRCRKERLIGFAGHALAVRGEVLGVVAIFGHEPFRAVTLRSFHNISGAIALGVRQKMEEEAKLEVEAQLRHAQKMEAVGRLAGGIAHDFNNLLSVITNYAEFIAEEAPADGQIRDDAREIAEASKRATELTRQLHRQHGEDASASRRRRRHGGGRARRGGDPRECRPGRYRASAHESRRQRT